jgi:tRNA-specific 2-thiouridylase
VCNQEIKFKAFLDYALGLGAEFIATGHYARSAGLGAAVRLLKGVDPDKDQSYFLYTLGQAQLQRSRFPVGDLTKPQVRALAAAAGLPNQAKKDSTGICFIGERRFKAFLARYLPAQPGPIETPEGEQLGRHDGLMFHTLGQRHGLGIGGRHGSSGEPWYVVAKDLARNVLVVAQGHDHPALFRRELAANDLHWVSGRPPSLPFACQAKVRYRQHEQRCTIEDLDATRCRVRFEEPQRAVTPGQSVVFYAGETCLGGGVIESTADAAEAPG